MQSARARNFRRCPRSAPASRAMIPRMTSAGRHRVSVVVDRSRFPKLFRFVEWRIDLQLAEVRELLHLPMPEVGLESGQNFAAATSLVTLIARRLGVVLRRLHGRALRSG